MRTRLLWCLLPAMVSAGCARYQRMPLTDAAVDRAMTAPTPALIRSRAQEVRSPLMPAVPIDFDRGLTPDAAAIVAVVANPALRVERDRHALGSAQLLQAGLLPNPTLDFTFDPVTGGNTLGAQTAYSIGPSWEVTALISHEAKVAAARAQFESVQLGVAWQEWQFAQAAKKSVYDLVALQAQLEQAGAVDQRLGGNAKLIRQAVDAHQRTLIDLAAADAAAQKAHADFLLARADFRRQQLALNLSLGFAPGATIRIASMALPSRLALPPERELLAGIETRRLDLLALRRGYESQEQTLRAAVLSQFPKIVLGFHQASDNTGVQSTGLGVTVDLPIFDRNQGNIAIQTSTRQQLFDEYVSRIFEARSAVAQSLTDIRSITEQIAAAEVAIPLLQELVKTYDQAIGEHNVDVLSYYAAQNDLAQKRIDLLKLKQLLMDNKIALEIATGRYLPDAGSSAPQSPATQPASAEARR